jgi:hypothetical protein
MGKNSKHRFIQLALFDPCGDDEPVAFVHKPRKNSKKNRRMFAGVIRKYNDVPDTTNVLCVIAMKRRAYVRPRDVVSRYKSTKLIGSDESCNFNT